MMRGEDGRPLSVFDPESSKANVEVLEEAAEAMNQVMSHATKLVSRPDHDDGTAGEAASVVETAGRALSGAMEESMASLSAALIQADRFSQRAGVACENAQAVASKVAEASVQAEAGVRAVEDLVTRAGVLLRHLQEAGTKSGVIHITMTQPPSLGLAPQQEVPSPTSSLEKAPLTPVTLSAATSELRSLVVADTAWHVPGVLRG